MRAFTLIETVAIVGILACLLTLGAQVTMEAKAKAAQVRHRVWLKQRIDRGIYMGWVTRAEYEAQMEWFRNLE